MKALILVCAAVAACASGPVRAQSRAGVELDPGGLIRRELLAEAVRAYEQHTDASLSDRTIAVVDFSKRSSERRLYLVDLRSGAVSSFLVAHGRGSDRDHDAFADVFSDAIGSNASSLGAYRAAEKYHGAHGLALSLDGLDVTNRSARRRAVVLHSQWYVSDRLARERGKIGRSLGCLVVDPGVIQAIASSLSGGGFIYAGR